MIAEIIAIGSEVVSGRTLDTNSQYLSRKLNDLGINVYYHTAVDDDPTRLKEVLENAISRSNLVITCGGLGPTKDDISKDVLAKILNDEMIYDEDMFNIIKHKFNHINKPLTKNNNKQAFKLTKSEFIDNSTGTAPGIFVDNGSNIIIMLPGPPRELKNMFENEVFPKLKSDKNILSKSIKTIGIGESLLETILIDLDLETDNITISTYAKEGMVEIRIVAESELNNNIINEFNNIIEILKKELEEYIYGYENTSIEESIINLLKSKKTKLGLCESCTGGLVSSRITKVSGSSEVFDSGIVTYSNSSKIDELSVKDSTLLEYGAVSSETAIEMARGLFSKRDINIVASITGIAGPNSDSTNKPVGLVYIGIKTSHKEEVFKFNFYGTRESIQNKTATKVFELLWRTLI